MKRILTLVLAVTCLAGCWSAPRPEPGTQSPPKPPTSTASGAEVKRACEQFNAIYAEFAAIAAGDKGAYDKIYQKAQEAKQAAPGDTYSLFGALSMLALERAAGDELSEASKSALSAAVMTNSAPCTAEGVTLKV